MRIIVIVGLLLCFSCNYQEKYNKEDLKQQIIQTDLTMSSLVEKEGFNASIFHYADENIVKLGEGSLPIIGKKEFEVSCNKSKGPKTITWIPINGEVAKSGELGYTWGNWEYKTMDTIYYGNYFTIWKRNLDGDWKVVLDGGNNTPKPN